MLRLVARRFCQAVPPLTGADFMGRVATPVAHPQGPDTRRRFDHAAAASTPDNESDAAASAPSSSSAVVDAAGTAGTLQELPSAHWMMSAARASMGNEFQGVDDAKFLSVAPRGFLTARATTDVQPAEKLLTDHVAIQKQMYEGLDVRNPSTVTKLEGNKPNWITTGDQVRAVSEFISGHLAHHVALPVWQEIFDLKHVEMDVMYWLWVLHLHIVARRLTSVPIALFNRRREVLDELLYSMKLSWIHTSEEVMGRPPLSRIRNYIRDMYLVTAVNLEEALMHDGAGGDLMLMGVLMKFCPLPRPEDVPMYTYYTLVHYVRFHVALFDRISDDDVAKGNFNFVDPKDPSVFKSYSDVELDQVIRGWKVGEAGPSQGSVNAGSDHSNAGTSRRPEKGGDS